MKITTLFLDIGGVILTNGWDHVSRMKAAKQFDLDWTAFDARHKQYVDMMEKGHISIDEYLEKVVFNMKREFTPHQFKEFMQAQSLPFSEMLNYFTQLKKKKKLKIVFVSNEGRFLAEYRTKKFQLQKLADIFIVSCFVGLQKPDVHIFKLALDVSHTFPSEIVYIDDRENLIEGAQPLGFHTLHHTSLESTAAQLNKLIDPS